MKVQNIDDVNEFFEVIGKCKGEVELLSSEGDRLNLKSKLTQYVAIANLFASDTVKELELVAHEPEDVSRIFEYMAYHKV